MEIKGIVTETHDLFLIGRKYPNIENVENPMILLKIIEVKQNNGSSIYELHFTGLKTIYFADVLKVFKE